MVRTIVFASHFYGYALLSECLRGELAQHVEVVALVSDDPNDRHCNAKNRIWRRQHKEFEDTMVVRLASDYNIATYTGDIENPEFEELFSKNWMPELGLMSVFGQILDDPQFEFTKFGTYNFHPSCCESAKDWPTYRGANAIQNIIGTAEWMNIVMHRVDKKVDHGPFVDASEKIYFPGGVTVMDLLKIGAPLVAQLARKNVPRIIKENSSSD